MLNTFIRIPLLWNLWYNFYYCSNFSRKFWYFWYRRPNACGFIYSHISRVVGGGHSNDSKFGQIHFFKKRVSSAPFSDHLEKAWLHCPFQKSWASSACSKSKVVTSLYLAKTSSVFTTFVPINVTLFVNLYRLNCSVCSHRFLMFCYENVIKVTWVIMFVAWV